MLNPKLPDLTVQWQPHNVHIISGQQTQPLTNQRGLKILLRPEVAKAHKRAGTMLLGPKILAHKTHRKLDISRWLDFV